MLRLADVEELIRLTNDTSTLESWAAHAVPISCEKGESFWSEAERWT